MYIYDRDGNPISVREWSRLHNDPEYSRVDETELDGIWISTVWLGFDHSFGLGGPRQIFETMVFDRHNQPRPGLQEMGEFDRRYSTEEEAEQGHLEVVQELKVLLASVDVPTTEGIDT